MCVCVLEKDRKIIQEEIEEKKKGHETMSDVKARRGSENDSPVIQSPVIQDVIERCRRRKSVRNHKPILIYIID